MTEFVTKHYGYYSQTFYIPNLITKQTVYVVFKGNLKTTLRPIAVVHTESDAVHRCKVLETGRSA